MQLTILPFGALTDLLPASGILIEEASIRNLSQLHAYLSEKYPALSQKTFRYAVNQQLTDWQHPLQPGDEVALLPPFSGG